MATNFNAPASASSQQLVDRLNEPQTVDALNRILDNIELISFSVTAMDGFLRRSEAVAESFAEGMAEMKTSAPANMNFLELLPRILEMMPQMLDLVERLVVLSQIAEFKRLLDILGNPQTLEAITAIMNNMELLSTMVTMLDGFFQRGDTIADNVAEGVAEMTQGTSLVEFTETIAMLPQLVESMPRLIETLPQLIEAGTQLKPLLDSPEFEALMQSGIFAPKTVKVVGQAGDALVESYDSHRTQPKSVGLFGLLRTLGDPDIQRALGFATEFGKQFGKNI